MTSSSLFVVICAAAVLLASAATTTTTTVTVATTTTTTVTVATTTTTTVTVATTTTTTVTVATTTTTTVPTANIRIGGPIQDTYKPAFMAYVNWANANVATNGGKNVVESFSTFNSSTAAALITSMTTAGNAAYVDVLVCPYGSTNVKACVDAVTANYVGPILAWGGASDAIFSTNCANSGTPKNCFGFFTVASMYTASGITAVDTKISTTAKVAMIVNNNGFSRSVAAGANTTIDSLSGMTLQSYTTISVQRSALTASDTAAITAAMAQSPDLVVIAGHNLDVEPTIIQIGKGAVDNSAVMPMAILATNGISIVANYGTDSKYSKCVLMPTQWDSASTAADTVVGWTSAAFKSLTEMGGTATYQQAAAGGAGVAIANALAINSDPATLVATMKAMDKTSFYGRLKWDAMGRIQKPMYTVQLQNGNQMVVAPNHTDGMYYPLSGSSCWNQGSNTSGTTGATTGATSGVTSGAYAKAASTSVLAAMLFAWMLQ